MSDPGPRREQQPHRVGTMYQSAEWTVVCMWCNSFGVYHPNPPTRAGAQTAARRDGWAIVRGRWCCAPCVASLP